MGADCKRIVVLEGLETFLAFHPLDAIVGTEEGFRSASARPFFPISQPLDYLMFALKDEDKGFDPIQKGGLNKTQSYALKNKDAK